MDLAKNVQQAESQLSRYDKKLAPIIKMYGPCKFEPHSDHYGELVSSIVGQQLSSKAGAVIWGRVIALFGGKMPSPRQLIAMDADKIRACGVSYPKIGYMKDLAAHILDGRLDLEHISTMTNSRLIEQLTAVNGIGEWSAHMFMIFGLGRLDILPVGDLGVRKAIMNLYGTKELPDSAQIIAIADKYRWHPYESVAAWYLWQSLDNSPAKSRHDK